VNTTHDGYQVGPEFHCKRVLVDYYGWPGITCWNDVFSFERESNWEHGDQRKYWSLHLLGFHFQGGWLWARAEDQEGGRG